MNKNKPTKSELTTDMFPEDAAVEDPVMTESSPESGKTQDTTRHEELHVTVEGDPVAWHVFCSERNIKPLFIELSNLRTQLMSAIKNPHMPGLPALIALFEMNGFKVVRVKHEVSALREGERALYYEAHVKLDGPFRTDRSGASRDLFRTVDTRGRWYRTKRAYGPFDALAFLELATTQSRPSKAAGLEYEICILDTNPLLDAGWL